MSDTRPHLRRPWVELLLRHGSVLQTAWRHRHELAGPRRLADEAAFLPAALSLQETPPHPAPRRAMWAIMALFAVALAWACVGQVDIVAIAPGRIVVSEGTKLIQPLEAGVVMAVRVSDGDRVQAGQVLVELDATAARADHTSVAEQLASARSDAARAQALLSSLASGGEPVLPPRPAAERWSDADRVQLGTEWGDIAAKRSRLDAEITRRDAEIETVRQAVAKLQATLPLARQREADFKSLTDQGFVAGHAGQDKTRDRVELERDLATQQARLAEVRAGLQESLHNRQSYLAETRRNLAERLAQAGLRVSQLQQEGTKAQQRERLARLTAPVAGTVQQVAVRTPGGVVTPAQTLMVVVPDEAHVSAEVRIDNKDIGFVAAGQHAAIKLEPFPFTRHGTVEAEVRWVSADAVVQAQGEQPPVASFVATLALRQPWLNVEGKRVTLSPGMNLSAEIRTGRRRVIDYLLSPVQTALSESLGER